PIDRRSVRRHPLRGPSPSALNATATTVLYTLSLHDALPISSWAARWPPLWRVRSRRRPAPARRTCSRPARSWWRCSCSCSDGSRSEEHTSELQSRFDLVCRLLLEKKKKNILDGF